MRKLFFQRALLASGWAEAVELTVDETGRIAAIDVNASPSAAAEQVAGVALPGLANVHSQAPRRVVAGRGERAGGADGFQSWRESVGLALAALDPDAFEAVATQLYIEMLKAGFTAVAEFHTLHHDRDGRPFNDPAEMSHRVVAAARAAGLPVTLLPVFSPACAQPRTVHQFESFQILLERLRETYAEAADVVLGIAPHALRAVPGRQLRDLVAAAPDGPIHMHIAEQLREVDDCLDHTGRRPVAWLLDALPVGPRWCLIHATHVTPEETAALARSGCVVGLCPTSAANLGDGLFPIADFQRHGGRFAIGSDCHVSVSPVEELRWLEYGARLIAHRRTVLAGDAGTATGRALFDAAAAGGAQACGLEAGALAVGKRADVVVLDDAHPVLAARRGDALLDGWIFTGNTPLVRHVFIAGRAVVRDGRHPLEDAAARRFVSVLERLFA